MENNDKILSMIGLSLKAGRLLQGNLQVKDATLSGKVSLVLLAKDLSDGTKKSQSYYASEAGIPAMELPVTMAELAERTGRLAGVLAVTDKSFARAIEKLLNAPQL